MFATMTGEAELARTLRRFRWLWVAVWVAILADIAWPWSVTDYSSHLTRTFASFAVSRTALLGCATVLVRSTRSRIVRGAGVLLSLAITAGAASWIAVLGCWQSHVPPPELVTAARTTVGRPELLGLESLAVGALLLFVVRERGLGPARAEAAAVLAPLGVWAAASIVWSPTNALFDIGLAIAAFVALVFALGAPFALARRALDEAVPSEPDPLPALRLWILAFFVQTAIDTWMALFRSASETDLDLLSALVSGVAGYAALSIGRAVPSRSLRAAVVTALLAHFFLIPCWRGVSPILVAWSQASHTSGPYVAATKAVTLATLLLPCAELAAVHGVVRVFAIDRPPLARVSLAAAAVALLASPWVAWLELKTALATPLEIKVLWGGSAALWATAAASLYLITQPPEDEPPEITVAD
jgi:hypothetical protein